MQLHFWRLETRSCFIYIEAALNSNLFDLGWKIKRLLTEFTVGKSTPGVMSRVKLLMIKVPTFDGNIFNWGHVWEQFKATVHVKEQLSGIDKLAYLTPAQHASKDRPARYRTS